MGWNNRLSQGEEKRACLPAINQCCTDALSDPPSQSVCSMVHECLRALAHFPPPPPPPPPAPSVAFTVSSSSGGTSGLTSHTSSTPPAATRSLSSASCTALSCAAARSITTSNSLSWSAADRASSRSQKVNHALVERREASWEEGEEGGREGRGDGLCMVEYKACTTSERGGSKRCREGERARLTGRAGAATLPAALMASLAKGGQ